jgi:RNA polymerase sigma factor (sigma-70 family)
LVKEWTNSAVDTYVNEIGRYPLLSAQEETELAGQYERGRAAERRLESRARNAQDRPELEIVVMRGQRARQRLIECNLRLVLHLIQHYRDCGLPFGDLVQEGNIGLIKAVERYDPQRGVRFATYAGWWIKQTVLRAVADQGQAIRLPPAVRDELRRLQRTAARLEARLGRAPTCHQVAEELGISEQRAQQLRCWDHTFLSLEAPVSDGRDTRLADLIPDRDAPSLEELIERRQLRERLSNAMDAHLGLRDRTLLRLRFGLDGSQSRTLKQVARALGVTRERARQVEKRALKQLRRAGVLYELGMP